MSQDLEQQKAKLRQKLQANVNIAASLAMTTDMAIKGNPSSHYGFLAGAIESLSNLMDEIQNGYFCLDDVLEEEQEAKAEEAKLIERVQMRQMAKELTAEHKQKEQAKKQEAASSLKAEEA